MPDSYQQGLRAMAAGRYREAVAAFEAARQCCPGDPQVQLWLVMAYEAHQQRELARNLCRELTTHPDRQVRQQSQQVLYILEAPQLRRRAEWLNEIPPLAAESWPGLTLGKRKPVPSPAPASLPAAPAAVKGNYFIPVALLGLSLGLLLWGVGA